MGFNAVAMNARIHRRILEKKNRVEGHRPLHPDLVRRIGEEVLVEYVHSSNVLEGSTLTLGETEAVIRGMTIWGKTIREIQEARNHPGAVEYIVGLARGRSPVTEETVREVHRLLLEGILEGPGEYRTGMIAVPGASFTPPRSAEVPRLVRELVDWLEGNPWEYTPVELAARFMHRFLVTHPFHDGNGRTARILMNLVLLRNGYPTLTNISYRDRRRYLEALGEADLGNPGPLVNFVAMSVEEALTKYLVAIEELETFSLREAAEKTPYSAKYLNLRARDGSLGAYKRGRNWRVTGEDLKRYVRDAKG
jgi:Fic family protein